MIEAIPLGQLVAPQRWGLRPGLELENPVRGVLQLAAIAGTGGLLSGLAASHDQPGPLDELARLCLGTHVALFTVSTAYHCLPWMPVSKKRMQRLDHAMIYVKIAGSTGPFAWVAYESPIALALIVASWVIACAGILQKLLLPGVDPRCSSCVQVAQALLALPPMLEIASGVSGVGGRMLIAASLCYAVGAVVFLLERPRLWPRRYSFHELFHTLVVAGGLSLSWSLVELVATIR